MPGSGPRQKLALAATNVPPAGSVALPARFLISGPGSQTIGAALPFGFVCGAANDPGAALARSHLRALAIDHLRRVGKSSATSANGHGLWFLFGHGRTSGPKEAPYIVLPQFTTRNGAFSTRPETVFEVPPAALTDETRFANSLKPLSLRTAKPGKHREVSSQAGNDSRRPRVSKPSARHRGRAAYRRPSRRAFTGLQGRHSRLGNETTSLFDAVCRLQGGYLPPRLLP